MRTITNQSKRSGNCTFYKTMTITEKSKHILIELKNHAPFTLAGAVLGIVFMLVFANVGTASSHLLFAVFHPLHVALSAMVTAAMFRLHTRRKQLMLIFIVGYVGSIGIATVSDVLIPHAGSHLLKMDIPSHAEVYHSHTGVTDEQESLTDKEHHHTGGKMHLGFIEEWYIVNPAALLGILIAYFLPRTRFPHAAHILISTWASSSYLLMNAEAQMTLALAMGILVTLFLATWVPCCVSDIVFPLMFVKSDRRTGCYQRRDSFHTH